jgi:hypothetical protein
MTYAQPIEYALVFPFVLGALCDKKIGLRRRANANPALTNAAIWSSY